MNNIPGVYCTVDTLVLHQLTDWKLTSSVVRGQPSWSLISTWSPVTGQFQDHLQGHLHGCLIDHLCLISDSIFDPISDPISGQLCDHHHDCPCDCLYNFLVDHLHLITGKLCDQLHIPNSDITKAQDPGLSLWEAMAKDRRILCSLIIQCCITCMSILMVSLMMGP